MRLILILSGIGGEMVTGEILQAVDKRSKHWTKQNYSIKHKILMLLSVRAYYQNLEFKVNDGKSKESSQKELSDDVLKRLIKDTHYKR